MRRLLQLLAMATLLALLSACGGTSSTSTNAASQTPTVISAQRINLAWIPPTTRADGSYMSASDLAGFRIYMGTSSNNLSPIVDLVNDNSNQYQVEDLAQGSYYFAITAYDQNGVESALSQVILIRLT